MKKRLQISWLLVFLMICMIAGCGTGDHNSTNANEHSMESQNHQKDLPDQNHENQNVGHDPNESDDPGIPDHHPDPQSEQKESPEKIEKIYYMNSIYDIKPIHPEDDDRVVLITIDDGPKDDDMVSQLLDVLDKHQAKAIFFLNGDKAKTKPELVKRIHERGQIIGNHSWEHINLKNESKEMIDQQIESVQQFIEETIGIRPQFFRPPHGAGNDYLKEKVKAEGMLYMTWSAAAEDWKPEYRTTEAIVEHVMEQLRPGSNILLHEVPWTVEAFDTLLTTISEAGYRFVDPRMIDLGLE